MKDKLLFENWREFLTETPERYYDDFGDQAPTGPSKAPRDPLPGPDPNSHPTVKEFMDFMHSKTGTIKVDKGIDAFGSATMGAVGGEIAGLAGGAAKDIYVMASQAANKKPLATTDYVENPYLVFLDFDPAYEKILHPRLFQEFLENIGTQLDKEGISEESLMPDIDQMLERYVLDKHGIQLDGARHADRDWSEVAGKMVAGTKPKSEPWFKGVKSAAE